MCLILFVLALAGLGLIKDVASRTGDPARLFFGSDHLGRRCGHGVLAGAPKLYFPRLSADIAAAHGQDWWAVRLYGVCVPACPTRGPEGADPEFVADMNVGFNSQHWPVGEGTVDVLNRCVPVEEPPTTVTAHYCAQPNCWETSGAVCADVPGREDEGLWLLRGGEGDDGAVARLGPAACARELVLTYTQSSRVPGTGPFVSFLARGVGSVGVALKQIVAARDEVLLCGLVLPVALGLAWLLFLRLFASLGVWILLVATGGRPTIAALVRALRALTLMIAPSPTLTQARCWRRRCLRGARDVWVQTLS